MAYVTEPAAGTGWQPPSGWTGSPSDYKTLVTNAAITGDTGAQKIAGKYSDYKNFDWGSSSGTAKAPEILSSDPAIRQGQLEGMSRGTSLYGQTYGQTGEDIQDIKGKRESALYGHDPVSTYMRQSGNRQIRQARASAGAAGRTTGAQEAQIRRSTESDLGAQMAQNQAAALTQYQQLIGNISKNMQTLELGWAGVEKSGQYVPPPSSSGDGLFSKIFGGLF